MGWGVNQEESFAELLQKQTSYNVLNAGISSYGTAREVMSLQNFDLSNLKYLVIQYGYNDQAENGAFIQNNYSLPVRSRSEYEVLQRKNSWTTRYYPFKYCLTVAKLLTIRKRAAAEVPASTRAKAVDEFIKIVERLPGYAKQAKIIVLYLPERTERKSGWFLDELKERAPSLYTIDVESVLKQEDYYILDEHLRASGHNKLTTLLAEKIREIK
jgi:hypothetical protein